MKNIYHNAIRDLIDLLKKQGLSNQLIIWEIGIDEVNDPTLISQRAYGTRQHADVVRIAAGTSWAWEKLHQKEIYLPTLSQITRIKNQYRSS